MFSCFFFALGIFELVDLACARSGILQFEADEVQRLTQRSTSTRRPPWWRPYTVLKLISSIRAVYVYASVIRNFGFIGRYADYY